MQHIWKRCIACIYGTLLYLDQVLAMYVPCIYLLHSLVICPILILRLNYTYLYGEMTSSQLSGRIQRSILSPNAMQINPDRVSCI